jgi:hypothetical protein
VQIARDEWRGLGRKARRVIGREARRGHLPNDQRKRDVAVRWAYTVVPVDEARKDRASRMALAVAWGALVETVLAVLHIGGDGSALGASISGESNWRERRLARRLRALDQTAP